MMVYAALEKNPFWEIFHKTVRRLGNIPPPAPGEPWMFALGEPGALEKVYRQGDFLNVSVRAVVIQRRSPSAVVRHHLRCLVAFYLDISWGANSNFYLTVGYFAVSKGYPYWGFFVRHAKLSRINYLVNLVCSSEAYA